LRVSDGTRTRDRLDHNTVRHFGGVQPSGANRLTGARSELGASARLRHGGISPVAGVHSLTSRLHLRAQRVDERGPSLQVCQSGTPRASSWRDRPGGSATRSFRSSTASPYTSSCARAHSACARDHLHLGDVGAGSAVPGHLIATAARVPARRSQPRSRSPGGLGSSGWVQWRRTRRGQAGRMARVPLWGAPALERGWRRHRPGLCLAVRLRVWRVRGAWCSWRPRAGALL
jgi:hypothetical protein